jgi:hypothetical protein
MNSPIGAITSFASGEHEAGRANVILVPDGPANQLTMRTAEGLHAGPAAVCTAVGGPSRKLPEDAWHWTLLRVIGAGPGSQEHAILSGACAARGSNPLDQ